MYRFSLILLISLLLLPLPVAAQSGTPITVENVENLVQDIANFLITIAGVVIVVFIVYGGLRIAMAGGDANKVKEGRTIVKNAIIGGVIIFGVGVILRTIENIATDPTGIF